MTHGSLFSGGGGFDLAAEWMGWNNAFHCEWDGFAQRILKYYWPNAKSYGDITKTDFNEWKGRIDVISGGFPCQPYSTAGKRKGKEDDRHLWPEMLRAIQEISPRWVVGENVRGLVNWNGGLVFDEVQADLEAAGYEVTPFLLPACAVNAPHRRERIWFVAHAHNNGHGRQSGTGIDSSAQRESEVIGQERKRVWDATEGINAKGIITNAECIRQQGRGRPFKSGNDETHRNWEASWSVLNGGWPTESPICSGNDGLSGELDGITFSDFSEGSKKIFGNAVVPQLVLQIFKAIEQYELTAS